MVTHSLYLAIYYRLVLLRLGCDVLKHLDNLIHKLIDLFLAKRLLVLIGFHNRKGLGVREPAK